MSSFKDLRIVDNFYQTSSFFPMPTVCISTLNDDGSLNLTPSPSYQTQVLRELGLNADGKEQVIDGCRIYPKTVFNPCDLESMVITPTTDTISIHHFMASWATRAQKRHTKLYALLSRILGKSTARKIKYFYRKIKKRFFGR